MGNPAEERQVFAGFLAAAPLFAGGVEVGGWCQPAKDPPDVEVDLKDGRKIAVELTSWLDESQIGREKKIEFIEQSFRDAINPEPPNETEHIFFVWLDPKKRLALSDRAAFRSELLNVVDAIDKRWDMEPDWQSPQGFHFADFTGYPTLTKYLNSLDVHPRPFTTKGGLHWLTFPMQGGAYSPYWMVDALCECIGAKINKYSAKPPGAAEFHLVVHYDKAFFYNWPVLGIDFGYAEAVKAASARIGKEVGMFDKIFVYVPVADNERVFQLYP